MIAIIDGQILDVTLEYTDGIDWTRCSSKRFHQALARFERTGKNLRWVTS